MTRMAKLRQLSLALAASVLLHTVPAFAACTNPAGNEGDINYGGAQHLMVYCNGTSWIAMGQSTSFGTLTTNDFCTATSSTGIQCTTGYTGSGNVVLATSPSLSSPTMTSPVVSSGGLTITAGGLTVSAGGAAITGTVSGTTFSGSGASLTGIGTSNMTAVTGTPSSTTFLAGNGQWTTPSASLPSLTNDYLWIGNGSGVATAVQMSGDCTITNAGGIVCTKTNGTAFGSLATLSAAPAGTLTGPTLASNVTGSSLTGVGTITSGVWNGTGIGIGYGGTNATGQTTNGVNYFNGTSITSGNGFVYSGGNVGIGTATPRSYGALDINTSSNKALHTMDSVYGGLLIGIQGSTIQARTTADANTQNLILQEWGGNVGIATTNPGKQLEVDGEIAIVSGAGGIDILPNSTGAVFYTNSSYNPSSPGSNWTNTITLSNGTFSQTSDARLKKDVHVIPDALDKLAAIKGVTFRWSDQHRKGEYIGVIAQDVEKVFPQAVISDDKGYKSVSYTSLVAPLIEAVKELKTENEEVRAIVQKQGEEFQAYRETHP